MTDPGGKTLRRAQLAGRWYPGREKEALKEIEAWGSYLESPELFSSFKVGKERDKVMALVPHAGWYFSGKLAAKTFKAARDLFGEKPPETVVVLGGHMAPGSPLINYSEEAWETPLNPAPLRPDLNPKLSEIAGKSLDFRTWVGQTNDNTIEVELPLVKRFFPESSVLALRATPDLSAKVLGSALSELFLNEKTLFVASTDLTHYGAAYDFCPAGIGPQGELFRERNDKNFIQAALSLGLADVLKLGNENRAACSAGAVAAVLAIASDAGAKGFLLDYYSSTDVLPGDQSVGYAGIVYAAD
jgi:AmmeMemoRadiSam system protein B